MISTKMKIQALIATLAIFTPILIFLPFAFLSVEYAVAAMLLLFFIAIYLLILLNFKKEKTR